MKMPQLILESCTWVAVVASIAASAAAQSTESIGDQLLEDLAPGMFDAPLAEPETEKKGAKAGDLGPDLNFRMPTRLDHWGSDVGRNAPNAPLPLVRARDGMQQATVLLAKNETVSQAGAAQQQVVAQLDVLIAELSKQCQGGDCKPSDQPPEPSQRSQAKEGKSGSKPGRGGAAARDSTDRLNGGSAQAADKADLSDVVKDLWGHLPERAREQMLQSYSGEFLPEYELEIEKYYRRLAEEQLEDNAN